MQNIDVLIVKTFSDNYNVSLYAAVGVVVKFSLIMIAVIETVVAPVLVDSNKQDHHKKYFIILTLLSGVGYIISLTLLPWLGNSILHFLKAELQASWLIWSALGVGMVSLGFFAIWIKVYMSWGRRDILYVWIFCSMIGLGVFFKSIEEFVILFASILVCLYGVTVCKVGYYLKKHSVFPKESK